MKIAMPGCKYELMKEKDSILMQLQDGSKTA